MNTHQVPEGGESTESPSSGSMSLESAPAETSTLPLTNIGTTQPDPQSSSHLVSQSRPHDSSQSQCPSHRSTPSHDSGSLLPSRHSHPPAEPGGDSTGAHRNGDSSPPSSDLPPPPDSPLPPNLPPPPDPSSHPHARSSPPSSDSPPHSPSRRHACSPVCTRSHFTAHYYTNSLIIISYTGCISTSWPEAQRQYCCPQEIQSFMHGRRSRIPIVCSHA